MTFPAHDELVLLALLVAVAALLVLAPIVRTPYPILLVLGGLALGFVPGMPSITLPPDLVLVAILPPLLYSAAFYTSLRDLRQNVRQISALAIGLVIATTVGVAAVAHMLIPELGWGSAFVLGAIVSPTDPLAATSIARRLGVPRRVITIVEGESLVNDGTALVLYRVAVVAPTRTGCAPRRPSGCGECWASAETGSRPDSRRRTTAASRSSRSRTRAIVGNATEHGSAVLLARRGRIKLAVEIPLASSAQIAGLLIPLVALLSWFFHEPLALSFRPVELAAMGIAAALPALVLRTGRTTRLGGAILLVAYTALVVLFYLSGDR